MSAAKWNVELHAHTIYSGDSLLKLKRIPELCQKRHIDKLAITDHNTTTAGLELARLHPMIVIPGIELMTTQGELLAWYVQGDVAAGLPPEEAIARLREQGAIIGVSHPFDRYRKGAWREEDLLKIIDLVDVVEVFNARCIQAEDNHKALAFAQAHGKLMSAGSDAHGQVEYGRATNQMPPFNNNAQGFLRALESSERTERLSLPSVHFISRWAKWMKRSGLVRTPGSP